MLKLLTRIAVFFAAAAVGDTETVNPFSEPRISYADIMRVGTPELEMTPQKP